MLKKTRLFFLLLLICARVGARNGQAYLVPQTVYVGDRAVLILPLAVPLDGGDIVLEENAARVFSTETIDIHRVALESRDTGSRLVVEFSAWAAGPLELPAIEIGGRRLSGIALEISSVLGETDKAVLSPSLPPAIVPGTALFVYGTMAALVLALLCALWLVIHGRRRFSALISTWKKRRLIASMSRVEKRLRKNVSAGAEQRLVLDILSLEFRSFLSLFSGVNCRAKTAGEFASFPFAQYFCGMSSEWNSRFLERFIRRCDDLRFSGGEIAAGDVTPLLAELRQFITALALALAGTRRERK